MLSTFANEAAGFSVALGIGALIGMAAHLDGKPRDTPEAAAESAEGAQMRADAMSRRRAMRAGKQPQE